MPPSAAPGSVATTSPTPKKEEASRTGVFPDDAVPSLGAALAGVSIGNGASDGVPGNHVLGINGLSQVGDISSRHVGLTGGGLGWGSAPSSGNGSIVNNSGFAQVFHGPRDFLNNTQGTPYTTSSADALTTFSEQLPSMLAARDSALKQQLGASGSAPSTPPGQRQSIDLFLSRSPSQNLGDELLKLRQNDNPSANSNVVLKQAPPATNGRLRSNDESNASFPPGFAVPQTQGRRNSSPSASVVGTATSSRSTSPTTGRSGNEGNAPSFLGHQHVVAPSHVRSMGEFTEQGGSIEQRNLSTNSLRSIEGNPHGHWNYGLPPPQSAVNTAQGAYAETKLPANTDPSMNQGVPIQQAPHAGDQVQHQPQAQQLFYMAVQTQDGRQVLQPVQMVQLPGQAPAMVLPAGSAPGLVTLSGAQVQGPRGQAQPVVLMPTVQPAGMPADASTPRKQGNRRNKGYNHQGQRGGTNMSGKHQQYGLGQQQNTGAMNIEHRNVVSPYLYGKQGATQLVEDKQRQPKKFGSASAPSYSQGEYIPSSRRTTPNSSQRSSPRESPTPNDFIASLYASPQRPPLNDLLGHVRRLSRDQVGCRLLQQALDEEGPVAATMILNEGLSFWGEAMVDPFGNYLFQKIAEKISADERVVLVRSVSARLVNASLNLHGTRSVQKVVELCAADEVAAAASGHRPPETAAEILTRSLATAAARLCIDSHGNHVIQRILLKLPYYQSQFVFDAVAASVGDVARHRHGCCVIQRCLDSPPSEARAHLVHRIVEKALELMQDAYGNYVVQYVLDVCGDDDVHAVCESVVGKVTLLAIQKFSSNVMEKCLERCTDRVRELYLNELSDQEKIRELMMDPFGNYVIQRALAVATHSQAVRLVEAMRPHLISSQPGSNGQHNGGMRNTAGGRRIMAKICRRFPNFNVFEGGLSAEQQMYQPHRSHDHRQSHRHQRQMLPSVSPLPSPARRGNLHHDRRNEHQQYQVAHQGHGPVATGSVPTYPMQMGNSRMTYPHSM